LMPGGDQVLTRAQWREPVLVTCPGCGGKRWIQRKTAHRTAGTKCRACVGKALAPSSRPRTVRCRHCQRVKQEKRRGLCYRCFDLPGVRDQYPSTSKYGNRAPPDRTGAAPLPERPTIEVPGSPGKIAVMAERARRGEQLFRTDDADMGGN
jgi:hypothetical protein